MEYVKARHRYFGSYGGYSIFKSDGTTVKIYPFKMKCKIFTPLENDSFKLAFINNSLYPLKCDRTILELEYNEMNNPYDINYDEQINDWELKPKRMTEYTSF